MKQLINVNYAVETFIGADSVTYVLRVMMDPRQAPIPLGVFSDIDKVIDRINEFNIELFAKTEQKNS